MSFSPVSSQSSVLPLIPPLGYKKDKIFKALEELSVFFENTMSLVPTSSFSFLQSKKILLKLKPIDHRFKSFFCKRRKLSNTIEKLDLEIPLRDLWRRSNHRLEGLDLELPKIPFFHHPHDFDNLVDHQSIFSLEAEKKPQCTMTTLENLAERLFQNLEFLTTPLHAANHFISIDSSVASTARFKLPPKTLEFIIHSWLTSHHWIQQQALGEGSYGRVFLVQKNVSFYAYKEFKSPPRQGLDIDRCLLLETSIHLILPEHPSIVRIQAAHAEGIYFSFDHGVTFASYLKLESLPYSSICEYFLSIAQALDHLHQHGFIYKDLKSSNIIIETKAPKAKLIDLGRATPAQCDDDNRFCPHITPPETILKKTTPYLTTRCDVWGFGVLLYQTLSCGWAPFFPDDVLEPDYATKVATFCQESACSKDRLIAQLSFRRQRVLRAKDPFGHLLELCARCLHGDPHQRPSMSELIDYLSLHQQKT